MKNTDTAKFENAVRALEFDKIREKLAYFAPTDGSKALARALMPSSSALLVKRTLAETDCAYTALAAKGMPPFGGVTDITEALDRADRGASITLAELLAVARVLSATRALRDYNSFAHGEGETALDDYFHRLVPQKQLEDEIEKAIIGPETLADTASDELYISILSQRERNVNSFPALNKKLPCLTKWTLPKPLQGSFLLSHKFTS